MVLMSGGFVINDVVWELHETTLCESDWDIARKIKKCYTDGTEGYYEGPLVYPKEG